MFAVLKGREIIFYFTANVLAIVATKMFTEGII